MHNEISDEMKKRFHDMTRFFASFASSFGQFERQDDTMEIRVKVNVRDSWRVQDMNFIIFQAKDIPHLWGVSVESSLSHYPIFMHYQMSDEPFTREIATKIMAEALTKGDLQ